MNRHPGNAANSARTDFPSTFRLRFARPALALLMLAGCFCLAPAARADAFTLSETVAFTSNAPDRLSVVLPDSFALTYTVTITSNIFSPTVFSVTDTPSQFFFGDAADLAILGSSADTCAGQVTISPLGRFVPGTATCTVTQLWLTPAPSFNGSSVGEEFDLGVTVTPRGFSSQTISNGITVEISDPPPQIVPSPEPASLFLLASGLMALGAAFPQRKKHWSSMD